MGKNRRSGVSKRTLTVVLMLSAVVGTLALATDLGLLYYNSVKLEGGLDTAALAGAGYLPVDPGRATQTAIFYAEANGIQRADLAGAPVVARDGSTIIVAARLGSSHAFLRVIGLYTGTGVESATARASYAPGTVGGGNGTLGNPRRSDPALCASIGQCDLLPIGLDYRTPYAKDKDVTLEYRRTGAGDCAALQLDGIKGADQGADIADGYPGPLSINQLVSLAPDTTTEAIAQGLSARIAAGRSKFPRATFSHHDPIDPRAVIVPMVDWDSSAGKDHARVKAFAALWVDSVNAHFIDQVAYNSPPDPNAPFRGARGRPILIR
jgi:hypothetical protein